MNTSTLETAVVDEAIWRAWVQKGKKRELAIARKAKVLATVAVALLALGSAFYLFAVK
jgi:hypothetical protein